MACARGLGIRQSLSAAKTESAQYLAASRGHHHGLNLAGPWIEVDDRGGTLALPGCDVGKRGLPLLPQTAILMDVPKQMQAGRYARLRRREACAGGAGGTLPCGSNG